MSNRVACEIGNIQNLPFKDTDFDLVVGVGPALIRTKNKDTAMQEIHRILKPGGTALVGGKYVGMPKAFKLSTQQLKQITSETGINGIRVFDDMGQWVEICK